MGAVVATLLILAAPASGASKNVELLDNLPEAKDATAINFMKYDDGSSVMLVTGRFGLKSYSLEDPSHPELLDEVTAEELRLPGDPPVNTDPAAGPISTFWQNEDMDLDQDRKLALLSRDPRAYAGSTTREPGEADPNNATNIAGVYVVDAKDPRALSIVSFQQLPTGHTTTCVNDCQWLWTGGPASTVTQQTTRGWTFGRPIIVTDLRDPASPVAYPMTRSTCSAATASRPTRTTSRSMTPASRGSPATAARAATTPPACTGTRSTSASAAPRRSTRSRTPAGACQRRSSRTRTADSSTTPGARSGARRRTATRAIAAASCCS